MRESRLELLSGSLPPDLWQLRRVHLSEELGRPFEAALEIVVAEEGGLADDILDELLGDLSDGSSKPDPKDEMNATVGGKSSVKTGGR